MKTSFYAWFKMPLQVAVAIAVAAPLAKLIAEVLSAVSKLFGG